jgi:hypothetical protein
MNYIKQKLIYGFIPIGIFLSYLLYQSPNFEFSFPSGAWLYATLFLTTIGSLILLINYFYNSKIIDGFAFLFIGVSIGLYGPLALGLSLPSLTPTVSSEIYDLNFLKLNLPFDSLPSVNEVSGHRDYQIYIEPLEDNLFVLIASPSVGMIDFSKSIDSVKYPETILSLVKLENSNLILEDRIVLSELENPIYYAKDLYGFRNKFFISSIGIDNEGCQSLQLREVSINMENTFSIIEDNMIFESTPKLCGTRHARQSGGRIELLDENTLLLTIGDFRLGPSTIAEEDEYDGRPLEMVFPNTYGMIISVNLDDYSYEPYSIGHRNPQGLFVDRFTGKIWSSEHGPSGGGRA